MCVWGILATNCLIVALGLCALIFVYWSHGVKLISGVTCCLVAPGDASSQAWRRFRGWMSSEQWGPDASFIAHQLGTKLI